MNTKTITTRTGSGTPKANIDLVLVNSASKKITHNGDGRFTYQLGWDTDGKCYETKSRGGGWRRQPKGDCT